MKYVMFLCTGHGCDVAERLKDYLQGKLRNIANMRSIAGILAQKRNLSREIRSSDCIVLFGTSQASSLIKDKKQETEDGFVTFDGSHTWLVQRKQRTRGQTDYCVPGGTRGEWLDPTWFWWEENISFERRKIPGKSPVISAWIFHKANFGTAFRRYVPLKCRVKPWLLICSGNLSLQLPVSYLYT